jgi:Restriction endonuclease
MDGMDTEALVVDALAELGIDARRLGGAADKGADLVLEADGVHTLVDVKRRSLVTDDVARRLLAEASRRGGVLLVVGDRVTESGRKLLTDSRAGYYDLRGRIALRSKNLVIDAEVQPVRGRTERTDALTGRAGLEVATALLMDPIRPVGVRELARTLGRSASTVSEVLAALRRDDLVDRGNAVVDTRLFWEVADRWSSPRTYLAKRPARGDRSMAKTLRLGLDDVGHDTGWALTDSAAAAAYGAPLALRSTQVLDSYVPDDSVVRRATTLLGVAISSAQATATVKVAPVPAVVEQRVDLATSPVEWPLTHPVFVALDLAQDVGRGREILSAWTPDDRWARVW